MNSSRATLKDIAAKLNISISTVSRALNDHPAINQKTKRMVKSTAKKLNYYPNLLALNLLQKKTNTIGVVVPTITSHFFSSVITGIQDILRASNYNILICLSEESYIDEVDIVENLMRVGVDGMLVSPSSSTINFDHFKRFKKTGIPLVVFDRDCPGLKVDKVLVDDYDGAFQAVDYLIKSGCKRVAHLGGPLNLSTTKHRLDGYLDALKKNNIPIDKKYIKHVKGFTHEDGIKPAKSLLKLEHKPDAIFAVNDCIAISAMYAAKRLNLKIPEEISIIGFDDEPQSSYFTPELSTIWQPVYSMGMLAARILLKRISNKNEKLKLREEIFKPELVIRASSKKI